MRHLPLRSITLIDLGRPMLDRAVERIGAADGGVVTTAVQGEGKTRTRVRAGAHVAEIAFGQQLSFGV